MFLAQGTTRSVRAGGPPAVGIRGTRALALSLGLLVSPSATTAQDEPPECLGTEEVLAFSGRLQTFVVPPFVTHVTIDAAGAQGGRGGPNDQTPGRGARLMASFPVTPGETLHVVVGGAGFNGIFSGGGGGGSFVYRTADASGLLVAAAGGGGGIGGPTASDGSAAATAAAGEGNGGAGGTGGNGGSGGAAPNGSGGGGGGLLTDGGVGSGTVAGAGGQALANGAAGGGSGGFGGGGGGIIGGGGGGGFNGGGGGGFGNGGGGGSFSATTPIFSASGVQTGNGEIGFCFTTNAAPTIAKSFTPSSVPFGGTATLRLTIDNPNPIALTGLSFSDTFPAGLAVANPPAVADACGFTTGIPLAEAPSFTVGGGSLGAGASCTFTLEVTATGAGSLANGSSGVSSNEAPTGAGSNTATLEVAEPTFADIPTLSELGLLVATLLLAGYGVWRLRTG